MDTLLTDDLRQLFNAWAILRTEVAMSPTIATESDRAALRARLDQASIMVGGVLEHHLRVPFNREDRHV